MSVYTDKIDNHSIHTSITNVQNELDAAQAVEDKTPLAVETLARIAFIVENLNKSLENCNKDLIATSWLDEATNALNNIKSYLSTYKNNKDANTLTNNSNSQLNVLLLCATKMNCVRSAQSLRGITAAENEYKKIMDANNEKLYARVKEMEEELASLKTMIADNEKASQTSVTELKQSINTEKQRLDSLGVSYQQQMGENQKSFLSMNEQLKDTFSKAQDERKKTFEDELALMKEDRANQQKSASEQSNEIQKKGDTLIEEFKQKFADYEEQVKNIVGIVNTNMFAHKYKEVADDAHKRARFWHGVAVVLMVLVSGFAVYAFVISANSDTSWVKLVAKIFATTTLVTGAAYAARQAGKQEKVERYTRKIEMELVAIDPFISSMDGEKQAGIKEEIARKIFGNADAMEISSKDEAYTAMDKLTAIEELLLTLIKKSPK